MAETLHPNALVTSSGFTNTATSVVASTNGSTADSGGNNDYVQYGFPSTSGSGLVTGAASQSFTIVAAKTSGSGSNNATYSVDLYQNGALVANLGTKALTSATMSTDSFTWDGSSYTGAANGADVEIRVTQSDGASGSPSKRAYVAIDEIYWTADSLEQISPAGINLRTVSGIDFSGATLDATHDAESGDLTGVTTETGTPTASSAQAYEGTYSYLCEGDPTTRDEFSVTLPLTQVGADNFMGVDFWAYWNNGIPSTSGWLWVEDGLAADNWYLRAEGSSGATGQFQLSDSTGVQQNFDVNLSSAAWYNFRILWKAGNTAEWYLEIRNSSDTLLYEFSDLSLDTLAGTNYANKMRFMGAGGTGTDVYQDLIRIYDGGEYLNSIPFGTATVAEASGAATLSAATGSFTLSGLAADLDRSLQLEASSASFTLSGQAADLDLGRQVDAESASFTLAGAAANFGYARHIEASPGSFVFGSSTLELGYFDSSDAAVVNNSWFFDAWAFDGDTGSSAETTTNGASLYGEGSSFLDLGTYISQVEFRGYGGTEEVTSALQFRAYHDGGGTVRGNVTKVGGSGTGYTTWGTITAPAGGWTWADVQALELQIQLSGLGLSFTTAHAVEIRATHFIDQADLDYTRVFQASSASFTLAGSDADLALGKVAALEAGPFTLSGHAAGLLYGRVYLAETRSYTLAGLAADIDYGRHFSAEPGAFSLTGQAANLNQGRVYAAEAGNFALTGLAADLEIGQYLAAVPASFTLAGQASDLVRALRLEASPASYALAGADATLALTDLFLAGPGSFTLGLVAADLERALQAPVDTASFTVTPAAADLDKGYQVDLEAGSFTLAGSAADLDKGYALDLEAGGFTLAGADAGLLNGYQVDLEAASFTLAGSDTAYILGYQVDLTPGSFTLAGQAATLTYNQAATLAAVPGSFTLAGQPADFQTAGAFQAAPGSFTLTGSSAAFQLGYYAGLEAGSFTAGPDLAAFYRALQAPAESGSFAIAGQADLERALLLDLESGSFAYSGQAAAMAPIRWLNGATGGYVLTGYDAALQAAISGTSAIFEAFMQRLDTLVTTPAIPIAWPGIRFEEPSSGMWLEVRYFPAENIDLVWQNQTKQRARGTFQVSVFWRPADGSQVAASEIADAVIELFAKQTALAAVKVKKTPWQAPAVVLDDKSFIPIQIPYDGIVTVAGYTGAVAVGGSGNADILADLLARLDTLGLETAWPGIPLETASSGYWLETRYIPAIPEDLVWQNDTQQYTRGELQVRVCYRPGESSQMGAIRIADTVANLFRKGYGVGVVRITKPPYIAPAVELEAMSYMPVNIAYSGLTEIAGNADAVIAGAPATTGILRGLLERLDTLSPALPTAWPGVKMTPPSSGMWLEATYAPREPGGLVWDADDVHQVSGVLNVAVNYRPGVGSSQNAMLEAARIADSIIDLYPKGLGVGLARIVQPPYTEEAENRPGRGSINVVIPYTGIVSAIAA